MDLDFQIRELRENDLAAADRIFRLAFGTRLAIIPILPATRLMEDYFRGSIGVIYPGNWQIQAKCSHYPPVRKTVMIGAE